MKILLVEDEQRIAQYIKKGLELKSHIVDVAYHGEIGYDLASSEKYDLIILDRMLPGKDGVTISKNLRADDNHTPILMLTAKTSIDDKVTGLDSGADDYLTKPFAFDELLARVRALARRPAAQLTNLIKVDNLEIDTTSYKVVRAGKELSLSKKEYSLLEFLARNKGQVFTKDQLTEHVWSYDADVLANTAQVYIGYLRKKIDTQFKESNPLIHTIRGFGYKLDTIE